MLSVFMALQELDIGTELVSTAFALLFGAVAFGLALAFGLGNRDLAGRITREWYERFRAEREAIERDVAERELEEDKEFSQLVFGAARDDSGRRDGRDGGAHAGCRASVTPEERDLPCLRPRIS